MSYRLRRMQYLQEQQRPIEYAAQTLGHGSKTLFSNWKIILPYFWSKNDSARAGEEHKAGTTITNCKLTVTLNRYGQSDVYGWTELEKIAFGGLSVFCDGQEVITFEDAGVGESSSADITRFFASPQNHEFYVRLYTHVPLAAERQAWVSLSIDYEYEGPDLQPPSTEMPLSLETVFYATVGLVAFFGVIELVKTVKH